jgi:hypothetical protein
MATLYSFDTSALIDGLERYYPANIFDGLWQAVDSLISDGRFFASTEVWEEIKKKDESVKKWAEPRRSDVFIDTDATTTKEVQKILDKFPRLVMSGGRRNRADPFVVAVASLRKATVVTGEGSDGTMNKPKIPYVCQQLNIPCVTFTEFISAEDWKFALAN